MAENRKIVGIYMPEPMREGEYPDVYLVGSDGVSRIERREENLGSYGVVWFDIFNAIGFESVSVNALYVASVIYGAEKADG